MLINANPLLRSDLRTRHFEQIELGGDLKKRIRMRRVCVQVLDVRNDLADRHGSGLIPTRLHPVAQVGQGRSLQFAAHQRFPVDTRLQYLAVHAEMRPHLLGRLFRQTGQFFKPRLKYGITIGHTFLLQSSEKPVNFSNHLPFFFGPNP